MSIYFLGSINYYSWTMASLEVGKIYVAASYPGTWIPGYLDTQVLWNSGTQVPLRQPLEVSSGHIALLSASPPAHPCPASQVSLRHSHLLAFLKQDNDDNDDNKNVMNLKQAITVVMTTTITTTTTTTMAITKDGITLRPMLLSALTKMTQQWYVRTKKTTIMTTVTKKERNNLEAHAAFGFSWIRVKSNTTFSSPLTWKVFRQPENCHY